MCNKAKHGLYFRFFEAASDFRLVFGVDGAVLLRGVKGVKQQANLSGASGLTCVSGASFPLSFSLLVTHWGQIRSAHTNAHKLKALISCCTQSRRVYSSIKSSRKTAVYLGQPYKRPWTQTNQLHYTHLRLCFVS